ncbi:ABC transporter ATP-binding protein [Kordiimonas sp. SCSIO 12610]|uniref:ABC transporter ATP-binding protein n=1 Tax=Kordiimonas sp. SCSIO 12610 TaxID=2829597 RepID=UPI00210B1A62|nr:ABC transporter ATP-binding protein [Kordiimonas sp. SCSIO 12610]UTW54695.1 ABC transporter ATP-binding protein [Kordiimonas sp. SCSIO 12610]
MTPLISAKNLVRHYQQGGETIKALDGVSVDIEKGELVAIMGPSGSGKSTFMNMCGALDKPTSGDLVLADRALSTLDSDALADLRNEVIGFVFQQFNLLPRTSALDNVKLPLLYARSMVDDAEERCMAALEAVDLTSRASHHPNELSGGQQQRVAIARALVNRPEIILADEPTGALDTKTSNEVLELFQRLNDQGMTIIMVTHDEEVAEFAKRCIYFRDGNIVDDTKPDSKGSAA